MKAMLFVAALVSLGTGVLATMLGSAVLPCYSDRAGCGMAEAFRLFIVPIDVVVAGIVFGIAAIQKSRRGLTLTMGGCAWRAACC